jgi:DNA-binding MarR family transcriptional regulator
MNDAADDIVTRLREGFERIALVLRTDLWAAAGEAGLNPAQAQVLDLLAARPPGLRPKDIAAHLGVSAASVADTLGALVRKGLVARQADPADARAVTLRPTAEGLRAQRAIAAAASRVAAALAELTPAEQANLLLAQVKLVRSLQVAGAIPVQRLCVTCRHFRPNAHPGAAHPHHCAFVNAAIGTEDLRLDCGEHEPADPAAQSANWAAFERERPPLQAPPAN